MNKPWECSASRSTCWSTPSSAPGPETHTHTQRNGGDGLVRKRLRTSGLSGLRAPEPASLDSLWLRSGAASPPCSEPWASPGERSDAQRRVRNVTGLHWWRFQYNEDEEYTFSRSLHKKHIFIFLKPTPRKRQSETSPGAHLVALDQQSPQADDLVPQLPDEPHVAVLVDGRLVDDVLGSVGVAQGAERLAVVHVGGGDGWGVGGILTNQYRPSRGWGGGIYTYEQHPKKYAYTR